MQEQKRYHHRKLAIIEMIEECDRCILREQKFIKSINYPNEFPNAIGIAKSNIARYERIKNYLKQRYDN